jgi:hypothetical protein
MSRLSLIAVVLSLAVPHAQAQDIEQFSERGPRFLLASATNRSQITRVDVARTPVLRRRVTIDYEAVTLDEALSASLDGAKTFLPEAKVSSLDACGSLPPQSSAKTIFFKGIGGHYHGMVGIGAGRFQLFWADARMGYLRLYSATAQVRAR